MASPLMEDHVGTVITATVGGGVIGVGGLLLAGLAYVANTAIRRERAPHDAYGEGDSMIGAMLVGGSRGAHETRRDTGMLLAFALVAFALALLAAAAGMTAWDGVPGPVAYAIPSGLVWGYLALNVALAIAQMRFCEATRPIHLALAAAIAAYQALSWLVGPWFVGPAGAWGAFGANLFLFSPVLSVGPLLLTERRKRLLDSRLIASAFTWSAVLAYVFRFCVSVAFLLATEQLLSWFNIGLTAFYVFHVLIVVATIVPIMAVFWLLADFRIYTDDRHAR